MRSEKTHHRLFDSGKTALSRISPRNTTTRFLILALGRQKETPLQSLCGSGVRWGDPVSWLFSWLFESAILRVASVNRPGMRHPLDFSGYKQAPKTGGSGQ